MKKIHTLILACLIFGTTAYAVNYQALDHRPDFINLGPQQMSEEHRRQASLGNDKALIHASYIKFNLKGLNVIKGNKGKFYSIDNTQMAGHQISMKLPNVNKPVLLNVENVQNLIEGEDVVTYTGFVADDSNDFFTLSISDKAVMGKINFGKYIYIIRPLEGSANKHSVAQLEKSYMNKDTGEDFVELNKSNATKNYVEKSANGSGAVKVLFYTSNGVWWSNTYVSTIISEMNAALARSGVSSNNYISSAGIVNINSAFVGQCKYPILDKMINATNEFSNIDQDLITYGADAAALLVSTYTGQDCGFGSAGIFGRVGGVATVYNQNNPFAVIADYYALQDLTALHELGHIFGGGHASGSVGVTSYSNGLINFDHQNPNNSWQTMMGSYGTWADDCIFSGPISSCERINYFSNPSLTYNGVTLGSSTKNMKNWLNIGMPVVSGWRGNPVPPPNVPNPISSHNESCFGMNSVSWTAQSGATEYKLYKSTSSSFTSPVLLYSGSNTTAMANVDSGTWYLRAQACNGSGCSAYSNQVTAYRYNGCL